VSIDDRRAAPAGPRADEQAETSTKTIPPLPWRCSGRIYMGLFRAESPIDLQGTGYKPLGRGNWIAITAIRYLEGPLKYDELVVGPLVRRGFRPGIRVSDIWVDDAISMRAGREVWGLPKKMARFQWSDTGVRVSDETGVIAELAFGPAGWQWPTLPLVFPGFGALKGRRTWVLVWSKGRIARQSMIIRGLSPRFCYSLSPDASLAIGSRQFDAYIGAPTLLDPLEAT
jgi:hypothetical protein